MARIVVSAQYLGPGSGGIARVGRLTVRALQDVADLTVLAVEDRDMHTIGRSEVRSFSGRRLAFAAAHNLELWRSDAALYDFPGTGRAHLVPGRPYAVWVHGNELWTEPVVRKDYARVIERARLILANSHRTQSALNQALRDLPPTVVCWLATEEESEPQARRDEGPPVLLFIGRSDRYFAKGQDILVRLWPQVVSILPDARLLFVGSGNHLDRLVSLVDKSPARRSIDVKGYVREEDMAGIWRQTSALALLGTLEGFGLVVVEAMRHGLPVLTSTQDAACEVNIDAVTGYNVDRNDENAVVDRIVKLLGDKEHGRTLGMQGQAHWRTCFRPSLFQRRLRAAMAPHFPLSQ